MSQERRENQIRGEGIFIGVVITSLLFVFALLFVNYCVGGGG